MDLKNSNCIQEGYSHLNSVEEMKTGIGSWDDIRQNEVPKLNI